MSAGLSEGEYACNCLNGYAGGATVAGALYGDTSPDESGGRVNVSLYRRYGNANDIGTAGANDFYIAEGIYLID